MVSDRARIGIALVAAWGLVLAVIATTALLVGADLGPEERAVLGNILETRAPHVLIVSLLLLAPLVYILRVLFRRYVEAPRALSDDMRIMLSANPAHRAPLRGSAEMKRLATDVNNFAEARVTLQREVSQRIDEANERLEQERNRLAALMSELSQSVVVCNVEGRILLYNARAMRWLRKPLEGETGGGGPSLVGLGRSVFAIFDRNLIIHALETIHDRLLQEARSPVAHFVTSAPSRPSSRRTRHRRGC